MTDLGRYIIEEWAEDYREGHLARREFLRRIGLFAGGATAFGMRLLGGLGIAATAEELASAAGAPAAEAAAPPSAAVASASMVPADDPSLDARMVSFAGTPPGPATVLGYLVQPKGVTRAPGVVVIHENQGLLDHHKDVARRVAKLGYAALAPDLASGAGGTDKLADSAQVAALLGQTPPEQLVAMPVDTVRYLGSLPGVRADRLGAMGFCFGGGVTWRLATQAPELRAVIPFYGPNPPLNDVPKIRAAILAFYGALDARIDAGIPAIRGALERAKIVHDLVVEPNAGHAFFNDTGANYNAAAAQDAWTRLVAWFGRYLAA